MGRLVTYRAFIVGGKIYSIRLMHGDADGYHIRVNEEKISPCPLLPVTDDTDAKAWFQDVTSLYSLAAKTTPAPA